MAGQTTVSLWQTIETSPWWLYAVLLSGLVVHVTGGSVAIVSGYAAAIVKKGGSRHRMFGKVFAGAMFAMTGAAFVAANLLHPRRPMELANVAMAALAAYLVATGWMAVRRPPQTTATFERVAAAVVLADAALMLSWGARATAEGSFDGYAPAFYYGFGGFAAFAGALDLWTIARGGAAGAGRIARHLWRMCFGLLVATGSFFLGQQKIMPAWLHGSPVLTTLALAPLAFLAFWLIRVRIGNRFRPATAAA